MQSSFWDDDSGLRPVFPQLDRNVSVDVAVIGGGIAGVTAAYLLKQAGATVALVEKGRCGSGETSRTTAHITYVTDTSLSELVGTIGRDHAQAVWHAGDAALLQIDETIKRESIDCDFEWITAYLHAPWDEQPADVRERLETEARLATELGFSASFVDVVPLANKSGIRFADQAQFHPLKYLFGLLKQIPGAGSHVVENTEIRNLDGTLTLHAEGHTLRCGSIFQATHTPLANSNGLPQTALLQAKLAAVNTYVVGARLPAGTTPSVLLWDTSHPYFYLRTAPTSNGEYVIFGGEDDRPGQPESTGPRFESLEQKLQLIFPEARIEDRWSGQVIETSDGLPYIGEIAPRQFIATGFSGNGMTFGTLAGMMVRDAISGISNPWQRLFQPSRTSLTGTWNYFQKNLRYPYYILKERLIQSPERPIDSLQKGEGCVLKDQGELVAAFRNDDGSITQLSPVCTHMGCIVQWNDRERTWDCPCHGSRFLPSGEVHAGPAQFPLNPSHLPDRA